MNQAKYYLLFTTLLTVGIIVFAWGDKAMAFSNPIDLVHSSPQTQQPEESTSDNTLPPEVKSAVLEDAVQRTSQTAAALRILEAERHTWSDGCLGLGQADQICTQALVPGWQVVVTDGRRNWTYRTDDSGTLVRLEESPQ